MAMYRPPIRSSPDLSAAQCSRPDREPISPGRRSAIWDQSQVFAKMIKWILILLVIAAVASLLGFGRLAGAAAAGAQILIGIVLILFLLVIFGVIAIA
jgi:uncharacterized membrane protein YtjA (UPF0391 family)